MRLLPILLFTTVVIEQEEPEKQIELQKNIFSALLDCGAVWSQLCGMLAARRLPEVLKSVLNDGVDGCCLMTEEGSILAAAFTEKSTLADTSLAAISSSIWNNISQGNDNWIIYFSFHSVPVCNSLKQSSSTLLGSSDVSLHILQFEGGCLGITSAGKGYILAMYGKHLPLGLLRGRLDTLSVYFTRMFEQLK